MKPVGRSSKANTRQVGAYRLSLFVEQAFEDDCFQPYSKLAESLRVGRVRVLLKTGAVLYYVHVVSIIY